MFFILNCRKKRGDVDVIMNSFLYQKSIEAFSIWIVEIL